MCSNARCPSSPRPCTGGAPIRSCSIPRRSCASRSSSGSATSRETDPERRAGAHAARAPRVVAARRAHPRHRGRGLVAGRARAPARPAARPRCGGRAGDRAARRRLRAAARRGAQGRRARRGAVLPARHAPRAPRAGSRALPADRSRSATSSPWERERLDELLALVLELLEQPELTGLEARNLVERRRAEALRLVERRCPRRASASQHAPRGYLARAGGARHRAAGRAARAAARPRRSARVAVHALDDGEWERRRRRRDRPGLLATIVRRPADHGLDILDALVATWGDGAALDSFRVRGALEPAQLAPSSSRPRRRTGSSSRRSSTRSTSRSSRRPNSRRRRALRRPRRRPGTRCARCGAPTGAGLLHDLAAGIAGAGRRRALGAARDHRGPGGRPLRAHRPQRAQARPRDAGQRDAAPSVTACGGDACRAARR